MSARTLTGAALILAAAGTLIAQPGQPAPDVKAPPDAKAGPARSPLANVPAYDLLKSREGVWDVKATFWLMPGAEPTTTTAACDSRISLGGLYLEERVTGGTIGGPQGGLPWDVTSFTGYDAAKKEYVITRFMSTSPVPVVERGTYDAEKKTLESSGDLRMMYMDIKMRTVLTAPDADRRIVEQFMSFNNAPEFKGIRIEYTRRK